MDADDDNDGVSDKQESKAKRTPKTLDKKRPQKTCLTQPRFRGLSPDLSR